MGIKDGGQVVVVRVYPLDSSLRGGRSGFCRLVYGSDLVGHKGKARRTAAGLDILILRDMSASAGVDRRIVACGVDAEAER